MNLYHLRYFAVLARMEHYTRAAAALNITQPSLSHAVSALEEELGVTLFDHVGRNVVLTKYGEMFLQDVEQSLEILDNGVERLQRIGAGQEVIDLGFLRGMSAGLIPELVSGFRSTEQGAGVDFHFYSDTTEKLLDGVALGQYDMAFCSIDPAAEDFDFVPVAHLPLCLVVPEGHPLADRERIRLCETLEYPHIIFSKNIGIRGDIDPLYLPLERQPKIAYELQEDRDIAGLVANGFGIAVLPELDLLASLPVKVIPLDEVGARRSIYLALPRRRYLSPAALNFAEYVRKTHQTRCVL